MDRRDPVVVALSLTSGPFPWSVVGAGVVVLLVAIGWRDSWWRYVHLPWALTTAAGAMVATATVVKVSGAINDPFPASFYVWVGSVFLAIAVAGFGWRSAAWWRRATSIVAVPLCALMAGVLINSHYGYLRDLTTAVRTATGRPLPHQVKLGDVGAGTASQYEGAAGSASSSPVKAAPVGQVVSLHIPARVSGFTHRDEYVYLPPAWTRTPRPSLPVVVLVAGSPGAPVDSVNGLDVVKVADLYAAQHDGMAPVLVMPDVNGSFWGDTECVDGPRGKAETYLTVDVPAYVKATFSTATAPAQWAISGFSEGGTCAVATAVRHPDVYGHFVDLSGDSRPSLGTEKVTLAKLFGGDRARYDDYDVAKKMSTVHAPLGGWFATATDDKAATAAAHALSAAATAAAIPNHLDEAHGGHNFPFWAAAYAKAWPWLLGQIGMEHGLETTMATGEAPAVSTSTTSPVTTPGQSSPPTTVHRTGTTIHKTTTTVHPSTTTVRHPTTTKR